MCWNWAHKTISKSQSWNETMLNNEVSPPLHNGGWDRTLPESAKHIVCFFAWVYLSSNLHCSRCKISFWVSCSHSPPPAAMSIKNSVQAEQEGIEPWSLNPVRLGIWSPPECWATLQSTDFSGLPNLEVTKNYQTAQRLKDLGINVMCWLSMIWFLQSATWISLKSPGDTWKFRCGQAYIHWCHGPTFL